MIDKVPLSRAKRKFQVPRCLAVLIPRELLSTRQASSAEEKTAWRPMPLLLLREVTGNNG